MKQPRRLTRDQKIALTKLGIADPAKYSLVSETTIAFLLEEKTTKKRKLVPKKAEAIPSN